VLTCDGSRVGLSEGTRVGACEGPSDGERLSLAPAAHKTTSCMHQNDRRTLVRRWESSWEARWGLWWAPGRGGCSEQASAAWKASRSATVMAAEWAPPLVGC
jgi:hypothetical protein